MRNTLVYLFLTAFQFLTCYSFSQETKITFNQKDIPVVSILDSIEKKSGYYFLYNSKLIDVERHIDINVEEKSVFDILSFLFDENGVSYVIMGRQIVLSPKIPVAGEDMKQEDLFRGRVLDQAGNPLQGVNVIIKGSKVGTITNSQGRFKLTGINPASVIVFSFVGFKTQENAVGLQKRILVTLAEELTGLDEVVVMGYSSRRRSEISSSVATVSNQQLMTRASNNVATMLQGKVAGVTVLSTEQEVGDSPQIYIRGKKSLSASNAPLYVVDGVIGGSFDPLDVAGITILKDAGATGLYGSRASGGVIIVTTKKGQAGKAKISINTTNGVVMPNYGNWAFMNTEENYDLIKQGYVKAGKTDAQFLTLFPEALRSMNYGWMDFYHDPGMVSQTNLSISGGNEKTTYYVSGNYSREDGMLRNDFYDRGSLTMNFSHKASDKLTFQINNFVSFTKNQRFDAFLLGNSPFDQPTVDPTNPFYKASDGFTIGAPWPMAWTVNNWRAQEPSNPLLWEYYGGFDDKNTVVVNPSAKIDYNITKWLTLSGTSRLNAYFDVRKRYTPAEFDKQGTGGYVFNDQSDYFDVLNNVILRSFKTFGDHSVALLVGGEFNMIKNTWFGASATGLTGGASVLDAAAKPSTTTGNERTTTYNSFLSQLDYNFKGKYFFTGSYRYDGSSRFGVEQRYGSFWSVAGSWQISEEDFMKNQSVVNFLKVRASYGLTGNANFDDYAHLQTFSLTANYMGNTALAPYSYGNPDLTWERAKTMNFGLDVSFFESRISANFDGYYTKNEDLLYRVPLASDSGYDDQWQNVGRLDTWGFEANIQTQVVKRGDFAFDFDVRLAYANDEVKSLYPAYKAKRGGLRIGGHLNEINASNYVGIDASNGKIYYQRWSNKNDWDNPYDPNRYPGLSTPDSSSTYNASESQVVYAKNVPDFMGGFSGTFRYKNWSFETMWQFAFGNYTLPDAQYSDYGNGNSNLYNPIVTRVGQNADLVRWYAPGDVAQLPAWILQNPNSGDVGDLQWVNANYLKIASLQLAYDIPRATLTKWSIDGLRVFARSENLHTFHNTSWISPEINGLGGTGQDMRSTRPMPTRYVLGINLTF